jgi:N-acetyl-gamma-glutamyl-phosphate reductase
MSGAGTSQARTAVSVLGAAGYGGTELLRLLARHPGVEVVYVSSEQHRGKRLSEVHSFLEGVFDLTLEAHDAAAACVADVVFTAVPHATAVPLVRTVLDAGRRVLDLSADFRFTDVAEYERWYGRHGAPELLREAVYGLPELYRDRIAGSRLVAVPGCYPTGALLGLVPLARAGAIGGPVVVDAKSGTTGAGRTAKVDQLFAEVQENFRPYGVLSHRHGPEIEQELRAAGCPHPAIFVPHLLPVRRGILSTMYVAGVPVDADLHRIYDEAYGSEPFVIVRGEGPPPELREVRGTNRCVVGWRRDPRTGHAVVMTAIDNLGKGAAGQAVQCMNLLLGLPEATGLMDPALSP